MTIKNFDKFFNPKSIAIIGASQNVSSISGKPLYYLIHHDYPGNIYPVNPKYDEIKGYTCFPKVKAIPGDVDLALLAVNYNIVYEMLEQCVEKGIPYAIIFSSGFAEAGKEGKEIQKKIKALCSTGKIRVCGPNCQGSVHLYSHTASAFSAALNIKPYLKGPVGFVTQSGAMGYSIFNLAQESGVGFTSIVSTGNEVDLDCVDFMNYLVQDENCKIIFSYMEGLQDGEKFIRFAEEALNACKPVIILKVGTSEIGSKAASSHTAAMTGSNEVFEVCFRQKGIIRVDDIEQLIDVAKVFIGTACIPSGKNLGILSTSGGGGVICSDVAEICGLEVATLKEETSEKIKKEIPSFGSAVNPVDMTAATVSTAGGFLNVARAMAADPGVDAMVVVITMIAGEPGIQMANELTMIHQETDKPIVVAWTSGPTLMKEQFEILKQAKIPYFNSPARAIKSLAKVLTYGLKLENGKTCSPQLIPRESTTFDAISKIINQAKHSLSESQAKQLLGHFDIPVTKEKVATSEDEACAIAKEMAYPVAMKIDSPDILHKTEAGAIQLNVNSQEELITSYHEILENSQNYAPNVLINGILVQEMIPEGVEVIVGMNHDPQFGPVIMFGLGGIFVEIIKDISLRVAPIDKTDALEMIKETKGYKILEGARGREPSDIDAVADILVKLSDLAITLGEKIKEIDINPLIVLPKGHGAKVADALVILNDIEKSNKRV